MIKEEFDKLIGIYSEEREIYKKMNELAENFIRGGTFQPENFIIYLKKRMDLEGQIAELEESIRTEKNLWLEEKEFLDEGNKSFQQLKILLKEVQQYMGETIKKDNEISALMKKDGIRLKTTAQTPGRSKIGAVKAYQKLWKKPE